MNTTELFTHLQQIITQDLEKTVTLHEESALIGESILDSLEFMNYLTKVEERFHVKISDADVARYRLGVMTNMIRFLQERIA